MRTKEEQQKYNQDYYQKHSEQIKENAKTWYKNHKKQVKTNHRVYQPNYRKRPKIIAKRKEEHQTHYETHKEQYLGQSGNWRKEHPKEMRIHYKKHCAKRRQLGFIPLNKSFTDSDGHHINKDFVIYIPHDLHISVSHNVWTGKGMKQINDKAFEWLIDHEDTNQTFISCIDNLVNQVIKNEL